MRQLHHVESWVVYEKTVQGKPSGLHVVCEQAEWEALDGEYPGVHTLVRSGIATEGEAERQARDGTPALRTAPRKYR